MKSLKYNQLRIPGNHCQICREKSF